MKFSKALGSFIGGFVFGTAGIAILASKDAKTVYTHCTAAVLRGKDSVMNTAASIKENCGDIYAEAVEINDHRYEEQKKMKVEAAKAVVEEYCGKEETAE